MDQVLMETLEKIESKAQSHSTMTASSQGRDPRKPYWEYSAEERAEIDRQQAEASWKLTIGKAGVPPRYAGAHLSNNCEVYRDHEGKRKAFELAREMSDRSSVESERGGEKYSLLISGGFGCGKTWLGTALFKNLMHQKRTGIWVKAYQFLRSVQGGYSDGTADDKLTGYQKTPVLMLDDLGDYDRAESENKAQLVYELIDYRNDYMLPTIITTNLTPKQMSERFGTRMFERVAELCMMVEMGGENLRFSKGQSI